MHILHGDDVVKNGFYHLLGEAFKKEPSISAAFCRTLFIDGEGHKVFLSPVEKKIAGIIPNWVERIALACWIQASSVVVKRSVYEKLGGFNKELVHTNDWDMWKRIAVHYPVWFEPKALACYRHLHLLSHSYQLVRTGANIADLKKSIRISEKYLSEAITEKLSRKSEKYHAIQAFKMACRLAASGDRTAAKAQIRGGLNLTYSSKAGVLVFVHFFGDVVYFIFRTIGTKILFFSEDVKRLYSRQLKK